MLEYLNGAKVGARLSNTGCPLITFSRISHTTGSFFVNYFLADLTVLQLPLSINLRITNGLYNSAAISLANHIQNIFHFWSNNNYRTSRIITRFPNKF